MNTERIKELKEKISCINEDRTDIDNEELCFMEEDDNDQLALIRLKAELQAREECQKEIEEKDKIMDNLKDLIFSHTRTKIQLEDIIAKQKKEFQEKIERLEMFNLKKYGINAGTKLNIEMREIFGEQHDNK